MEAVMARYVAGELRAFDALYERTASSVFGYLLSMTHDRARAEDLCQTTFLKLHRARAGWIPGSPVLAWVMAIARNALYDNQRASRRNPVQLTATGEVPEILGLPGWIDEQALDDERSLAAMTEVFERGMAELPPQQREALALTKQAGLSHRDAALALGTTEAAIKLRVHRAYETLRAALRRHRERQP